jgi:hypothetical protein
MSKQFKEKTCVYCNIRKSIKQGDHVFARKFFLENERENLIKVPACNICNNEKSKIEHYLTTVLPFGGRHIDAKENLSSNVAPRLNKNKKLHRHLEANREYLNGDPTTGESGRAMVLPFDGETYAKLFEYILKALVWYHWKVYIQEDTILYSTSLSKFGEELFEKHIFSLRCENRIINVLGKNTFRYRGIQVPENKQITFWLFEVYNGLVTAEQNSFNKEYSDCLLAMSGDQKTIDSFKELMC